MFNLRLTTTADKSPRSIEAITDDLMEEAADNTMDRILALWPVGETGDSLAAWWKNPIRSGHYNVENEIRYAGFVRRPGQSTPIAAELPTIYAEEIRAATERHSNELGEAFLAGALGALP